MTNSFGNQPRQIRDVQSTLRRIVKRLGNNTEGDVLNDASKALRRGDYGCAISFIGTCYRQSLNLNRGEADQLKIIIRLLLKMRFYWIHPFVIDLIYWLALIPFNYKIKFAVWLCNCLQDTPLVYSTLYAQGENDYQILYIERLGPAPVI